MRHRAEVQYKAITAANIDRSVLGSRLSPELAAEVKRVARVLPFKINNYVVEELIDWSRGRDDPLFCMLLPNRLMLPESAYEKLCALDGQSDESAYAAIQQIRNSLNPHPSGQRTHNHPTLDGEQLGGLQHKYAQTVLFFPSQSQTCHAYCSFCFRWAQFVGDPELKMASHNRERLYDYLDEHPEVTDLIITGGDPMVMRTQRLRFYLEPLLQGRASHVKNVRIGTKVIAFWPYRLLHGQEADTFFELVGEVQRSGRSLAFMAHISHVRELQTQPARTAVGRLRAAGVTVRAQAPVLRHVNDSPRAWAQMWEQEIKMDIVPYYMFVERPTGARSYFQLPLSEVFDIYRRAVNSLSGLGRTARGPVMSTLMGKVELLGLTELSGQKVMSLRYLQARDADWCHRVFFARLDPEAHWFTDLEPANDESAVFFDGAGEGRRSLRIVAENRSGQGEGEFVCLA